MLGKLFICFQKNALIFSVELIMLDLKKNQIINPTIITNVQNAMENDMIVSEKKLSSSVACVCFVTIQRLRRDWTYHAKCTRLYDELK